MRFPATIITFLIATLFIGSVANAQRERRRQLVEGLLEGLIESQLEKLIEGGHDQGHNHNQNNARPTQPATPPPPEIRNARIELQHISGSMRNLVNVLQSESYSTPAYRQPLAEAMHIKAAVDALYQNSVRVRDIRRLTDAYIPVDQQWRSLAHRLSTARGVNRSVVAIIDETNTHTAEMGALLGLQPQLDRTELIRLSTTLTTEFEHLLEDISYDMRGKRNQVRLLQQGQQLLSQLRQATAWIDRGDYDSLVQAWQQGQAGWRPYAAELRRSGSSRISRDVMKIEQAGRQITEALWLPIPVDKDYLSHLVASVEADVDHILTAVTMKDMMACPKPTLLLRAANELQASCGSFGASIQNSESIDDLVWDFRVFDVAWHEMASQFQTIVNPEVQRHLRDGTETLSLLNQSLGSGPQISQAQINQMVSELGELCNRTTVFVNQQIMPAQEVDYRVKNKLQTHCVGLQTSVRSLHTRMISQQPEQLIEQDLATAIGHWNKLKPLMRQCRKSDLQKFRQLRGELEPLFVKLQVVNAR